ncbi:MAG: deoxyribodipyrimidine photo-lyase [Prolixibacteraceae bacterium]|nr:deoxyribodipyrimidine photo-lyase [Prolixibacteraceae bacterium]
MTYQDKEKVVIFCFRRDLRLNDNHGFFHALNSGVPVLPVFIFDKVILKRLNLKDDPRVSFIFSEVAKLKAEFEKCGSSLRIFYDEPAKAFSGLMSEFDIKAVFVNKDYEPYARQRDNKIRDLLLKYGIGFNMYKDHVIFEENEIVKENGDPYTVSHHTVKNGKRPC